ncbi:DNA translocase FtsK, partial [Candidatus Saccharibacteria bacterium]|nr:DNA translocase FtsK [Candidatus Saccharibacteria bacterium]
QYQDIPHLLTPIITQTDKALSAMKWSVGEMERRYTLMAEEKVKNIADYNTKIASQASKDEEQKASKMPYIVIVIDEMADLMMMAGKDLEMLIVRIAQKGRAAGIHLVLATQRPEVKVITGLIKANIPGRIAFAVGSQMDSRIMLDQGGAEKLLGKGDMLLLTTEMMGKPRRIQGAWASDPDISKVTDYLREQRPPEYNDEVVAQPVAIKGLSDGGSISDLGRRYDPNDPTVRKAIEITLKQGKFSTASLQTWLGKGHGFVAGLAIWLEEIGVIGPQNGNKPREVLITSMEEFDQLAQH